MLLREIFDALTYGELSQLNIGGAQNGFIDDANYDKMLAHVNLGLTALHRRFNLKRNEIELVFMPGATRYHLHSDHRYSDEEVAVDDFRIDVGNTTLLVDVQPSADAEYIRDFPYARFQDDLLKVERVMTPDRCELPVNQPGNCWSVMTPSETVIQVPLAIVDQIHVPDWLKIDRLLIDYRQNHRKLRVGEGEYDANRVEINLPDAYLPALLYYVASRVHAPIGAGTQFNPGTEWYAKYEAECQRLTLENLAIDQEAGYDRIRRQGWA